MSNYEFTLCHRIPKHSRYWICKDGFSAVYYADLETTKLRHENNGIETRLFPFSRNTPTIYRACSIKWELSSIDIPPIKYV